MEAVVRKLFERYESNFNQALRGKVDMNELASLYASEFIGAAPAGIRAGKNDDRFKQALAQGYDHYRAIGTKEMRVRNIRTSRIDELHCIAHVAWTALYVREDQRDVSIDFDVHYLIQLSSGEPKIFGWVSSDEQTLLKRHGIT